MAVIVTVPALNNVTSPVVSPTVAIVVLLLVYVIAPGLIGLALFAVTVKAASVTFLVVGGLTNVSVGVPLETVSELLVLVALVNCPETAACVKLKLTSPSPTILIQLPDASIVATPELLLVYVIAPLLLVVGRRVILKDASPYALEFGTVNVPNVGTAMSETVSRELTLLLM